MRITYLSNLPRQARLPRRATTIQPAPTAKAAPARSATVQELTRDLAGWSMPPAGPASAAQPMAQWLW